MGCSSKWLKVKNPDTAPNFFDRYDGNKLVGDQTGNRYLFRLGRWNILLDFYKSISIKQSYLQLSLSTRYYFDNNPLVGKLAGISAWDSVLSEEEMKTRTSCSQPIFDQGNLISGEFELSAVLKYMWMFYSKFVNIWSASICSWDFMDADGLPGLLYRGEFLFPGQVVANWILPGASWWLWVHQVQGPCQCAPSHSWAQQVCGDENISCL